MSFAFLEVIGFLHSLLSKWLPVPQIFFFFGGEEGPNLQQMEVPRLGVELELQLLACPTAIATLGP